MENGYANFYGIECLMTVWMGPPSWQTTLFKSYRHDEVKHGWELTISNDASGNRKHFMKISTYNHNPCVIMICHFGVTCKQDVLRWQSFRYFSLDIFIARAGAIAWWTGLCWSTHNTHKTSAVTKATQVEVVFDQPGNGQHFSKQARTGLQAVGDLKWPLEVKNHCHR